jgi:hypothetical protein
MLQITPEWAKRQIEMAIYRILPPREFWEFCMGVTLPVGMPCITGHIEDTTSPVGAANIAARKLWFDALRDCCVDLIETSGRSIEEISERLGYPPEVVSDKQTLIEAMFRDYRELLFKGN